MTKITAIILAKNEEQDLQRAVQSVSFCDETIVLDDNSTDSTPQICRKNNIRHIVRGIGNSFAQQRNFGMEQAKHDWILYIDADEVITRQLQGSIEKINDPDGNYDAFYIKRRDFWWGKELRYGEVYKARKDGIIRLIKKNRGVWKGDIHEIFVTKGSIGTLDGFIDHYPHQTLKEFIHDVNNYSTRRARELYDKGRRANIIEMTVFPLMKFILTYIVYLGFLDGAQGFVYAFLMSFHSFLVRAKLFQYREIDIS